MKIYIEADGDLKRDILSDSISKELPNYQSKFKILSDKVYKRIVDSTPVRSGKTKRSWKKTVETAPSSVMVDVENYNYAKNGEPIVNYIINGHYTGTSGYVRPNDFLSQELDNIDKEIDNIFR